MLSANFTSIFKHHTVSFIFGIGGYLSLYLNFIFFLLQNLKYLLLMSWIEENTSTDEHRSIEHVLYCVFDQRNKS